MPNSQLLWGFYREVEYPWVEGIKRSRDQENPGKPCVFGYTSSTPSNSDAKMKPHLSLLLPPTVRAPPAPHEESVSLQESGDLTQTDFHELLPKGLDLEGWKSETSHGSAATLGTCQRLSCSKNCHVQVVPCQVNIVLARSWCLINKGDAG